MFNNKSKKSGIIVGDNFYFIKEDLDFTDMINRNQERLKCNFIYRNYNLNDKKILINDFI